MSAVSIQRKSPSQKKGERALRDRNLWLSPSAINNIEVVKRKARANIASNKPLPTPVLLSHLHAGTQRTFQPRPRGRMLVLLNFSCLAFILAFVLA